VRELFITMFRPWRSQRESPPCLILRYILYMKRLFVIPLFFIYSFVQAQSCYTTDVILQETQFALESQIYGTRYGFVKNLDTLARGLNKTGFTEMYKIWKGRKDPQNGFILLWEPTFIYAGSNGLIGISYGPSYTKSVSDSFLRHTGFYFTIWSRKQSSGPFKMLFDSGIPFEGVKPEKELAAYSPAAYLITEQAVNMSETDIRGLLAKFKNQAATTTFGNAIAGVLRKEGNILISYEGILNKDAILTSATGKQQCVLTTESIFKLSNSLYVEYGIVLRQSDNKKGHYAQVWNVQDKEIEMVSAFYKID